MMAGFSRIVLLCYMEVITCCFICIKEINPTYLKENGNPSDMFSYVSSYATLSFLMVFPFIIIIILSLYKKKHGILNDEFSEKYKPLVLEIKTNSLEQGSFHAFYMMRRIVVTYALVFMNDLPLLAI